MFHSFLQLKKGGGGQKAGEICHLLFSARLPAYSLYLMHRFCIGVYVINHLYSLALRSLQGPENDLVSYSETSHKGDADLDSEHPSGSCEPQPVPPSRLSPL